MKIVITAGVGSGKTALSAFDMALYEAGIANYNLIPLSSVIPTGSVVAVETFDQNEIEHGYKLYLVLSRKDQETIGRVACAGLGWRQQENGAGIFVEHCGESEEDVKRMIRLSLDDVIRYRPDHYGEMQMAITKIECVDQPVSAVVAAVYESRGWRADK